MDGLGPAKSNSKAHNSSKKKKTSCNLALDWQCHPGHYYLQFQRNIHMQNWTQEPKSSTTQDFGSQPFIGTTHTKQAQQYTFKVYCQQQCCAMSAMATGEKRKTEQDARPLGYPTAFHPLPINKPANKTTFALIRQKSSTPRAQYDSKWGNYRDISSLRLNPRSSTTMGGTPPCHPSIVFNNFNFAFAPTMIIQNNLCSNKSQLCHRSTKSREVPACFPRERTR